MVSAPLRERANEPRPKTPRAAHLLIAMLGAPTAWSAHLFASYGLIGVECNGGISPGVLIAALTAATIIFGGIAVLSGLTAYQLLPGRLADGWRGLTSDMPGRLHFFAGTGLLLSAIFLLLIVFQAITPLVAPMCPEVLRVAR